MDNLFLFHKGLRLDFFLSKTRGRSNTNPTASEVAQAQAQRGQQQRQSSRYKEMASAFYTLNSKHRISWECVELLVELGGGGSASATTNCNPSSVPPTISSESVPLGSPLPSSSETKGGASVGGQSRSLGMRRSLRRRRLLQLQLLPRLVHRQTVVCPHHHLRTIIIPGQHRHDIRHRQLVCYARC